MTIKQPRNVKVFGPNGSAELKFNINFGRKWTEKHDSAQIFVDSEVLRHSEPFIPLLTGTMIRSGILGTDIGSGKVQWITPYARRQYFAGRRPGESKTGPLRGRLWFARMIEVWRDRIIAGAKKIIGG